ncbi:large-conductance mechanosensitive channel protein MscL [Mycolicibacterium komossense]|jgi:large conductance mechanosensitive channel|uniref:Large-conductance mechanosensitive channel n=1 Tax=Mycolicibacterium komossense TaxID=1779 RepID=A0ABT3CEF2_9MYCO|nr:large-conductance mechanosensitive channel protein MscL [Mycolicibacterium komossense]MCV7227771.1 large-conductance mechanosensitive channel protein MscL [Mycolicibacterium komossense]
MLKGFKDFISRGNVIDLAVAVVIGTAFTGLVKAFTDNVIQPLIDRIGATPGKDYGFLKIPLGGDTFVNLNAVLTAGLNFLIVAAVVYFIIVAPFKKLKERDKKVAEGDTELTVLTEIRDLLRENGVEVVGKHGTPGATPQPQSHEGE